MINTGPPEDMTLEEDETHRKKQNKRRRKKNAKGQVEAIQQEENTETQGENAHLCKGDFDKLDLNGDGVVSKEDWDTMEDVKGEGENAHLCKASFPSSEKGSGSKVKRKRKRKPKSVQEAQEESKTRITKLQQLKLGYEVMFRSG